jgi:serine/threonine protein kinase
MVDPRNPATVVQYLIFELASGDVRSQLDAADQFDTAWALRSLHQIANGLKQLHGLGIAHQDLKPSNVLSFPDDGSKIADLGRSACKELTSPYDDHKVAGDRSYAPPELLYGHIDGDWTRRRIGCDAYLLGSMVVFLFHRVAMTTLILDNMERSHHWRAWDGTFEEVLPYLRDAFGYALRDIGPAFPPYLRDELTCIARELCEPDPRLRGHPANRTTRQNQYSLERYVSRFNLLASKVELGLLQR